MNFIPLTKEENRLIKAGKKFQQTNERLGEISTHQYEPIQQNHSNSNGKTESMMQKQNNEASVKHPSSIINSPQQKNINGLSLPSKKPIPFTHQEQINFSQQIEPISLHNCKKDEGNIIESVQPQTIVDAYQSKNCTVYISQNEQIDPVGKDKDINDCIIGPNPSALKSIQKPQSGQMINAEVQPNHQRRRPIFVDDQPTVILIPTTSEDTKEKKAVTPSKRQLISEVLLPKKSNISHSQEQELKIKNSQTIILGQADIYESNEDSAPLKMRRRLSPFSKQTIKPINRRNYQKEKQKLQERHVQVQQQLKINNNYKIPELKNDLNARNLNLNEMKPSQGWDQQHQIFKIFNIPLSSRQSSHINFKKPFNSLLLK